ncbi:MAG: ParB/RepB/Spo0J family partition protein [Patescibacteria group bacterium]
MAKYKGLGRGLGSLISGSPEDITSDSTDDKERIIQVEVYKVKPNPSQPRHNFDHASLEELIDSIKEHGIIQPLIVTKDKNGYQLIAGERRLKASKFLELPTVPVIIREANDQDRLELALIENIQRKDLNAIEKAKGYQQLVDQFNLSQEQVAKKVGKSRVAVSNTLRLLTLPEKIQQAITEEKISEGQAKAILGLASDEDRLKLLRKVLSDKLTVRETEKQARKTKKPTRKQETGRDPALEEKIDQLRQALGTKVEIKREGNKGQIIIEFYSNEELQELINKIT